MFDVSISTLLVITIIFFIPTAWAIIHIAYRDFGSTQKKALWGLLIVFVQPVGGIIYLVIYHISCRRQSREVAENPSKGQ